MKVNQLLSKNNNFLYFMAFYASYTRELCLKGKNLY